MYGYRELGHGAAVSQFEVSLLGVLRDGLSSALLSVSALIQFLSMFLIVHWRC